MILIDYSNLAITIAVLSCKIHHEANINFIRQRTLSKILFLNKKFKDEYQRPVFCCDAKNKWRKEIFPNYKFGRNQNKENIDWNGIHNTVNGLIEEIEENFGYFVIRIDKCEGDDIIAVLANEFPGPHLVVSSDRDFIQLQASLNKVVCYSPFEKKYLVEQNPIEYLERKIIRGDESDSIPNIASDINAFVNQKRQSPIRKEYLERLLEKKKFDTEFHKKRYYENKKLIDLNEIPESFVFQIKEKFLELEKTHKKKNVSVIMKYLSSHSLKNLFSDAGGFISA